MNLERKAINFEESGMKFRFYEDIAFYLEDSSVYKRLACNGVAGVECVVYKNKYICFIEAKTNWPDTSADSREVLNERLVNVKDKYTHSVILLNSILNGGFTLEGECQIGAKLEKQLRSGAMLRFIFIVREYTKERCAALQTKLNRDWRGLLRVCNADIFVLNEAIAKDKNFIVS